MDLVTFTEEILNGKLHFLRSDSNLRKLILIFWEPSETSQTILARQMQFQL